MESICFAFRVKLLEAEEMCSQLRKQVQRNQSRTSHINSPLMNSNIESLDSSFSAYSILREAKEDVRILSKHARALEKEK